MPLPWRLHFLEPIDIIPFQELNKVIICPLILPKPHTKNPECSNRVSWFMLFSKYASQETCFCFLNIAQTNQRVIVDITEFSLFAKLI